MSNANNETVWISGAFGDTSIIAPLREMLHDRVGVEETREEMEAGAALSRRYQTGKALSEDEIPRRFCGRYGDTRIRSLPDFFFIEFCFVVSQRCADVFNQFDLGEGGFYPVEIYHGDRKTRVAGEYYFLNFGCQKTAFVPERVEERHTLHFRPSPMGWWFTGGGGYIKEALCPVTRAALEGPDLWMDTELDRAFFLSDRLVKALRAAKLTRTIRLNKCFFVD